MLVSYVASRASVPERPAMWKELRDRGAVISSSWIDEAGAGETLCFKELWHRINTEIFISDQLVLYVEPEDFPLKGALVEVGMALGLGKPVIIVAQGVDVVSHDMKPLGSWAKHPGVRFENCVRKALGLPGSFSDNT